MNAPPLPHLPPREPDSHKGDFGRALVIGGSPGMPGAVALSGMAALRSGAGLVRLAVPRPILATVASFEASCMTARLPCDERGRISLAARDAISELAEEATVVACGPGLGRSRDLNALVAWLYSSLGKPLVVDADGLNALAEQPSILSRPGGARILTPHPGEFRRLAADSSQSGRLSSRGEMENAASELAGRLGAVVVLKGRATFVTDGRQSVHNATGNPGMATGGTGDVLTGVITALLCQGLSPFEAAHLAVHVHGLAGDLAAAELGQVSLIASDLLRFLPPAFRGLGPGP